MRYIYDVEFPQGIDIGKTIWTTLVRTFYKDEAMRLFRKYNASIVIKRGRWQRTGTAIETVRECDYNLSYDELWQKYSKMDKAVMRGADIRKYGY